VEMSGLTKLCVCVLIVVSATILGACKIIEANQVGMLLTGVLGYVFGNGHGILSVAKGNPGDKGNQGDNGDPGGQG
jgi:hypothetical protein